MLSIDFSHRFRQLILTFFIASWRVVILVDDAQIDCDCTVVVRTLIIAQTCIILDVF